MIQTEKVEYERSIHHNYLILKENEENICFEEIRMVMENKLNSFLRTELQQENEENKLYYEISSLQSIYRIFEYKSLSLEDVFDIFRGILSAVEEIRIYLLSEDAIVLQPEYIFMNMEQREVKFLYYPKEEQDFLVSLKALAEYILEKVNHQEEAAVAIGYRFYKIVQNENFVLDEIRQLMQSKEKDCRREHKEANKDCQDSGDCRDRREKTEANDFSSLENNRSDSKHSYIEKNHGKEKMKAEESANNERMKPEEKNSRKKYLIIICGAVLLLLGVCYQKNLFGLERMQQMIFLAILGIGLAGYIYYIFLSKRKNNDENTENEEKKAEAETITEFDLFKPVNISGDTETEAMDYTSEEYGKTMYFVKNPQEDERILVEEKSGKTYRLNDYGDCILIGKLKEQVDILLGEKSVSRIHARILKENQKLWIEDMQSTNGTFLNGIQLDVGERMPLEAEDRIEIGKMVLVYR